MRALLSLVLMLLILAASAGADSLADLRAFLAPDPGGPGPRDGRLINDGSFEDGTCQDGASAWTCESSGDCDWILDLTAHGLWNYDGIHSAALGTYCQGVPVEYTHICQDILIDGTTLSWYALQFSIPSSAFTVSLDGEAIQEVGGACDWIPCDYTRQTADVSAYMGGVHRLCFDYVRNGADPPPACFIDYVELSLATGVPGGVEELTNLSTVKALY